MGFDGLHTLLRLPEGEDNADTYHMCRCEHVTISHAKSSRQASISKRVWGVIAAANLFASMA